jgi:hypothetical protein
VVTLTGRFQGRDEQLLAAAMGARQHELSHFQAVATPAEQERYRRIVDAPRVEHADELEALLLGAERDPSRQVSAAVGVVGQRARRRARTLGRRRARRRGGGRRPRAIAAASRRQVENAAVLLAAVLASVALAIFLARSMVRPLLLLEQAAKDVAERKLPSVVDRLHRGEPVDLDAETRPIDVGAAGEIGRLASAFTAVQRVAVSVAIDHHLATRMRRNAESLIVLSGSEPGHRLTALLRAAVSEIEDYTRVRVLPIPPIAVVGHAVVDVAYLLAELAELVAGNERLANPPLADLTVSRMLGFLRGRAARPASRHQGAVAPLALRRGHRACAAAGGAAVEIRRRQRAGAGPARAAARPAGRAAAALADDQRPAPRGTGAGFQWIAAAVAVRAGRPLQGGRPPSPRSSRACVSRAASAASWSRTWSRKACSASRTAPADGTPPTRRCSAG